MVALLLNLFIFVQKEPINDLCGQAKAVLSNEMDRRAGENIPLVAWRRAEAIKVKYQDMLFAHAEVHAAINQGVNLTDEDILNAGNRAL